MSSRKQLPAGSSPSKDLSVAMDSLENITFPSCEHLRKLLSSNARDSVIRNYNLAVKISLLTCPRPGLKLLTQAKGKASKAGKMAGLPVVDNRKLSSLRSSAIRCVGCVHNLSVNLICLQCPHVGCFDKKHAIKHSQGSNHVFAISTLGQIYCFRCNDYVSDPGLEKVRITSLINSRRYNTAPGMPIYPTLALQTDEAREFAEENSVAPSFKAQTGLRGFVNMGATCYMSTIIQTLIHNPLVRDFFLSAKHFHCIKRDQDDDTCITCRIDEVFTNFYTSQSVAGYGLTSFLATCWKINKSLAGYTQQDAHEFWQFVLGEFHKSHLVNSKNHRITLDEKVNVNKHTRSSSISFGSNDHCDCITHKIFSGELQSTIKCLECENVNKTVDPMIDLLLEIKSKQTKGSYKTLEDCLNWFTKPETLESNYLCNHCQTMTSASKKLSIKKLGPILSIQLKRFEHLSTGTSIKLEDPIQYPVILDVTKYCTNSIAAETVQGELTYELFAIVCHIGQVSTGHYICIIKNSDGQVSIIC